MELHDRGAQSVKDALLNHSLYHDMRDGNKRIKWIHTRLVLYCIDFESETSNTDYQGYQLDPPWNRCWRNRLYGDISSVKNVTSRL